MTDSELRELCHRFLDAIETHDFDVVEALYHPELRFWFNVTGREITVEENLAALREGIHRHRRRTYDSRIINTFETGFTVQYSVNVVAHNGRHTSLWACLVAQCRDGRIWRLDEYLDSGKFGATTDRKPVEEASA
jgi:ketosteroid isomerase-like protein